jgi:hypothetical protein
MNFCSVIVTQAQTKNRFTKGLSPIEGFNAARHLAPDLLHNCVMMPAAKAMAAIAFSDDREKNY